MEYTAAVLRNRGVQVETAVLAKNEDGGLPSRSREKDGSVKTDQRWVRFDANSIADMEEVFGSLAKFEEASRETPFNAIRKALALVWECTPREAGMMMLDGKIGDYSTAVGVALSIANGVDPTQAARLLKVGVSATTKLTKEREEALEKALQEAEAEERRQQLEVVKGGKDEDEEAGVGVEMVDEGEEQDSTPKADSPGDLGSDSGSEPADPTADQTASGPTPPPRSSSPSGPGTGPKPPSGEEEKAEEESRSTAVHAVGLRSS